jgi:hypothetical protein
MMNITKEWVGPQTVTVASVRLIEIRASTQARRIALSSVAWNLRRPTRITPARTAPKMPAKAGTP